MFGLETCFLYNFQTFADIFTRVGTNLKARSDDVHEPRLHPNFDEGFGRVMWAGGMKETSDFV